jgi:hypothetical protein
MTPARRPPMAAAYESATSRAFFDASWCTAISIGTPPPAAYVERTVCPGAFGAIITTSRSARGCTWP